MAGDGRGTSQEMEFRPLSAPAELQQGDKKADVALTARPFSAEKAPGADAGGCVEAVDDIDAVAVGSGLEMMTQEAIAMFQDGRTQEALDLAVQFTMAARSELGCTHPVYINALATVAALVDQMGGSEEADALLLEAEDLQDEMEMEALGIDFSDDDLDAEETAANELSSRPPTGLSNNSARREILSRGSQHRSSTATGASTGTGDDDGYSDDEDWMGPKSSDNGSDADGDVEGGALDNDEDGVEAEAEAITRLTFEVNTLLSHDNPEEAAKLLCEAEHILVNGGVAIGGLSKAALHTLWAAVLSAVGEEEKAQHLYEEAMHVLQTEAAGTGMHDAGSTSDGGSEEADSDSEDSLEEEEEEEEEEDEEESCISESEASDALEKTKKEKKELASDSHELERSRVSGPEPEEVEHVPSPRPAAGNLALFATEPEPSVWKPAATFTASDILLAKERAAKLRASMPAPNASSVAIAAPAAEDPLLLPHRQPPLRPESKSTAANVALPLQPLQQQVAGSLSARGNLAASGSFCQDNGTHNSETISADLTEVTARQPTPPLSGIPKRRSRPALAPQPKPAQPAAKSVAATPASRCGGGFAAVKPPPSKPKAKAKVKLKPKAAEDEVVEEIVEVAELAAPMPEVDEVEEVGEPAGPPTAEEQLATVQRAMTCADHFLGLMNFERAADKLEEQLVALGEENSPHRHTDLHVEVMMRYGGILWWDGDPEGAIDAFTAAEEVLTEKPKSNWQSKRRTEIWVQSSQVCRGCGDLESAHEQLAHAVLFLTDLVTSEPANIEYKDSLREAQASLAQICVQLKNFTQAEELYMAAFGSDCEDDEMKRIAEGGDETSADEDSSASEGPAETCKPKRSAVVQCAR